MTCLHSVVPRLCPEHRCMPHSWLFSLSSLLLEEVQLCSCLPFSYVTASYDHYPNQKYKITSEYNAHQMKKAIHEYFWKYRKVCNLNLALIFKFKPHRYILGPIRHIEFYSVLFKCYIPESLSTGAGQQTAAQPVLANSQWLTCEVCRMSLAS